MAPPVTCGRLAASLQVPPPLPCSWKAPTPLLGKSNRCTVHAIYSNLIFRARVKASIVMSSPAHLC